MSSLWKNIINTPYFNWIYVTSGIILIGFLIFIGIITYQFRQNKSIRVALKKTVLNSHRIIIGVIIAIILYFAFFLTPKIIPNNRNGYIYMNSASSINSINLKSYYINKSFPFYINSNDYGKVSKIKLGQVKLVNVKTKYGIRTTTEIQSLTTNGKKINAILKKTSKVLSQYHVTSNQASYINLTVTSTNGNITKIVSTISNTSVDTITNGTNFKVNIIMSNHRDVKPESTIYLKM